MIYAEDLKAQEYQKEYRQKNLEKRRNDDKEYYNKNKEMIAEKKKNRRLTPKGKYSEYKSGARKRNLEWDLSFDEFMSFWQQPCHYCNDNIEYVGIDRKINTLGYSINNCVSCCIDCNKMKMNRNKDVWIEKMKTILSNLGEK